MQTLSAVDWILLAVLGLSLLLGMWRGIVQEVLSLAGWVAAFYVSQMYAPMAAAWLPMEGSSQIIVGFFAISLFSTWAVLSFWSALKATVLTLDQVQITALEQKVVMFYRYTPMLFLAGMVSYLVSQI